ncbi:hypothetical protein [Variovorax sp. N23]|uniref:hypothetical protein n=1 Tax=Variovorax sp. N23 TaxID=2980555 RepID=UPI0021CA0F8F|nr:hypothetical protein [Variovorax sp. N23]MCU4117944.1 hypothetical protein [Variovorax sp. N23]
MRLLVLVLAIVLLPLRGWLGDAMMLAPVQPSTAGHAMHAMADGAMKAHGMHAMPSADDNEAHAMHAAMDPGATHDGSEGTHAAHATCDTCQFCHSVAVTAWPEVPMPVTAPAHAPVAEAMRFASAEAVQGFKPPIS